MHEGSGEVSSQKLGAVGRDAAPVAVAADKRARTLLQATVITRCWRHTAMLQAPVGKNTEKAAVLCALTDHLHRW